MSDSLFTIHDAVVVHETEKALRIRSDDLEEEVWVPKSQIHDDSDVYDSGDGSGPGRLVVSKWLAEKNGWT
jgi:hypothetical protein